jgi:hypothetical protein
VILVVASRASDAAAAFAGECGGLLLTCRDLAERPLVVHHPSFERSTLGAGGRQVEVGELTGAVNLLPVVFPEELVSYAPEERAYQAEEFDALLAFLLSALPCPVVNRPAGASLCGRASSVVGWYPLARRLGLPVASIEIDTARFENPFRNGRPRATVECLGGAIIASAGTAADRGTLALAAAAGLEYLKAVYDEGPGGPELFAAHAVPDVTSPRTRSALVEFLGRGSRAAT